MAGQSQRAPRAVTRCASALSIIAALAPGNAAGDPRPASQPAVAAPETVRIAALRSFAVPRARVLAATLPRVSARAAAPGPQPRRSARSQPPARAPRRVGWGSGETLTYRAYLAGVEIGRAAVTVGSVRGREDRVIFRAQGETNHFIRLLYELREELRAVADLNGLRPLRAFSHRVKRSTTRKVITVHGTLARQIIERGAPRAVAPPPQRTVQRRRFARHPFDPLTALYHLRSVDLSEGGSLRFTILAGTALHAVELRHGATERLRTAIGPRECIRLEGWAQRVYDNGQPMLNKPRRRVSIWLTADALRIPVRAEGDTDVGFVDVSIHSFEPARSSVAVRSSATRRTPYR